MDHFRSSTFPIATSVVLVNSHPLFVVIAAYFFSWDRPTRPHIAGTVIGLAGMAIARESPHQAEFGSLESVVAYDRHACQSDHRAAM